MNPYSAGGDGGPQWQPPPGQFYPPPPQWPGHQPPLVPPRPVAPKPASVRSRVLTWVIIVGVLAGGGVIVWRGIHNDDPRSNVAVNDLRAGQCIDLYGDAREIASAEKRNCTKSHEAQVLYRGPIDTSRGEAGAEADAYSQCSQHARPLLMAAGFGSEVELRVYYSTEQKTWRSFTGVLCIAVATGDYKLTAQIPG